MSTIQRYQIQKYFGKISTTAFFLARDILKDIDVLATIVTFPDIENPKLWRQLLSYYQQVTSWSHNIEVDFISPIQDYGELTAGDTFPGELSQHWDKFPSDVHYACYFTTLWRPLWKWLDRKLVSPQRTCMYLIPVLHALGWLHDRGICYHHLNPWSIIYNTESLSPQITLLNPGIISPGHIGFSPSPYTKPALLSKEDGRSDLFSLATTFYFLITGKLNFAKQENIVDALRKLEIPEIIVEILVECLKPSGSIRFSNVASIIAALQGIKAEAISKSSFHFRHLPLKPSFQSCSLYDRIAQYVASLKEPKYEPQKIACFFNAPAGMGKSTIIETIRNSCEQSDISTISLVLAHRADFFLSPMDRLLPDVESNRPVSKDATMSFLNLPTYFVVPLQERYLNVREQIVQHVLKQVKPQVILCDNLHWAGEEFWDILEAILREHASRISTSSQSVSTIPRLFVLGSGNFDEGQWQNFCIRIAQNPVLKLWITVDTLQQADLSGSRIVASILGISQAPPLFSSRICELTHGNPLYIRETLAILLKRASLYWDEGDWYIQADTVEKLAVPETLERAVEEHFQLFSIAAQKLMKAIGILAPIKFSTLIHLSSEEIIPILWQLYRDQWIGIGDEFEIFPSSTVIWQFLYRQDSEEIHNLLYNIHLQLDTCDRFCLSHFYLRQKHVQRLRAHFWYVAESLLNFGWKTALFKWLHLYSQLKSELNADDFLYLGELAFLSGETRLANVYLENVAQRTNISISLLRLAEIAREEHRFSAARQYLVKARQEIIENSPNRALYDWIEGYLEYMEGKPESARQYWQNALNVLLHCFKEGENSRIPLALLAHCQMIAREPVQCMCILEKYLSKFAALAQHIDHIPAVMHSLRWLALFEKRASRYEKAITNLYSSLELARQIRSPLGEILALIGLADTHVQLACYSRAQSMIESAIALCIHHKIENFAADGEFIFGKIAFAAKNYPAAIAHCQMALASFQGVSKAYTGFVSGYLSEVMITSGNFKDAVHYWEQGRTIAQDTGYPELKVYFVLLQARLHALDCKQESDLGFILDDALHVAGEYELYEHLVHLHYQRGIIWQTSGRMDIALEHFQKAWEIVQGSVHKLTPELKASYLQSPVPKAIQDIVSLLTSELSCKVEDDFLEIVESNPNMNKPLEKIISSCQKDLVDSQLNILREENDNLKRMLEINKELASEHQLNRLLEFIVDTAIEITKAERGFLILATTYTTDTTEKNLFEVARNFEHEDVSNPQFEISHSITEKVIRTGLPILTKDALQEFDGYRSVSDLKLHSLLAVPLIAKQKVIGALYIDNRFERAVFSEKEKQLLEAFADQASIAIDNARLFEENMRLNQELSIANAQLAKQVENQKEELQEIRNILHHSQRETNARYYNIIGKSLLMQEVFQILDKVADKNIPVHIYGESGTGKELVAKAIHFNSSRRDKNFLSENCASFSDNLLESELFGHVKGAFTGAYCDKKGLFELADGGTLFLDEVGDMSPNMQASLLRVLETNLLRRVGGKDKIAVDVRMISASNKDIKQMVEEGTFRKDLFFRLHVVQINLPSLRQRKEDVPILVEHFLEEYAKENSCPIRHLDKKAMQIFMNYDWPGNIREMRNVLYNALSIYDCLEFTDIHFQEFLSPSSQKMDMFQEEMSIDEYARRFVKSYQNKYNDSHLSRILGFSRKTLWEKRKKWNLFRD